MKANNRAMRASEIAGYVDRWFVANENKISLVEQEGLDLVALAKRQRESIESVIRGVDDRLKAIGN